MSVDQAPQAVVEQEPLALVRTDGFVEKDEEAFFVTRISKIRDEVFKDFSFGNVRYHIARTGDLYMLTVTINGPQKVDDITTITNWENNPTNYIPVNSFLVDKTGVCP